MKRGTTTHLQSHTNKKPSPQRHPSQVNPIPNSEFRIPNSKSPLQRDIYLLCIRPFFVISSVLGSEQSPIPTDMPSRGDPAWSPEPPRQLRIPHSKVRLRLTCRVCFANIAHSAFILHFALCILHCAAGALNP